VGSNQPTAPRSRNAPPVALRWTASQRKPRDARSSFVIAPYRPGTDGRLRPEVPVEGPCRDTGGSCRLVVDHWRDRKTGPCFPILVMRCTAHGRGFTLYPPGHVPYGRLAIAPVAPDGSSLSSKKADAGSYSGTVFEVARDAARGRTFRRESGDEPEDGAWWSTARRRLPLLALWLGVSPALSDHEREERSADLHVALLPLQEGAKAVALGPGCRSRGLAVTSVLSELPSGVGWRRLYRAGHSAGLFGEPLLLSAGGRLRSLAAEQKGSESPSSGPDPPRLRSLSPGSRRR
jgi:hypothetical protein